MHQGRYGPIQPHVAVEVPIWLALQLHKRNKARILPPAWLDSQYLDSERATAKSCLNTSSLMSASICLFAL
jgi:hypothetical protein